MEFPEVHLSEINYIEYSSDVNYDYKWIGSTNLLCSRMQL